MTILHIVPDDALGGGAVIVARLMEVARASALEPQMAVLPDNSEPRLRALFAGFPHRFARYRGRGSVIAMALAILTIAHKNDTVHAHGTRAAIAAVLAGFARSSLTVVYTVHGFHGLAKSDPFGWRIAVERLLARRVHATAFVSASDKALAEARSLRYLGATRIIENGLPSPPSVSEGERDIDILFVGRLVPQKWPEAFVETVALVPGSPRVVMVGAGESARIVDALVASKSIHNFRRFDGLDHPEVLELMFRARVLVITSRWEGLPTVAIEAMICGAVPVGFDIPPLREALGPCSSSLVTPADPAQLAALLSKLLANETHLRSIAAKLMISARRRFDPEVMFKKYLELYGEAKSNRGTNL